MIDKFNIGPAGTSGRRCERGGTRVGIIYVGPRDDFGYNQAQAEAAAELKKMPGVKVVEEENVPETQAVQKTMQGMISQDGASLLFPTSFGYFDPHMLAMAAKNPKGALRPLRRHVDRGQAPEEHRQLLRLHRRGAVPQRRDRRPHEQEQEDRLHRGQADPAGAAQHQRLHDGRALGRPEDHLQRDLHRRLVACRSRKPRPPTAWPTRASMCSPCTSTARR
jgi:hypothetical protein